MSEEHCKQCVAWNKVGQCEDEVHRLSELVMKQACCVLSDGKDCPVVARAKNAESEVERLKGEVKRLTEWQAVLKALHDAINAADLDVSSCRKCGCLVVCLPDGMPMCRKCAEKREGGA